MTFLQVHAFEKKKEARYDKLFSNHRNMRNEKYQTSENTCNNSNAFQVHPRTQKAKIVSCTDRLRYSSVNIKVLNDFLETNLDPVRIQMIPKVPFKIVIIFYLKRSVEAF